MGISRTVAVASVILAMSAHFVNAQDSRMIGQWQVFEVEMTAAQNQANPYPAYLREGRPGHVAVCFAGVSGDATGRELTVTGFWDGGTTWKARFAPSASGDWVYGSRSEDPGLNGVTGKLTCTAWTEDEKKGLS